MLSHWQTENNNEFTQFKIRNCLSDLNWPWQMNIFVKWTLNNVLLQRVINTNFPIPLEKMNNWFEIIVIIFSISGAVHIFCHDCWPLGHFRRTNCASESVCTRVLFYHECKFMYNQRLWNTISNGFWWYENRNTTHFNRPLQWDGARAEFMQTEAHVFHAEPKEAREMSERANSKGKCEYTLSHTDDPKMLQISTLWNCASLCME